MLVKIRGVRQASLCGPSLNVAGGRGGRGLDDDGVPLGGGQRRLRAALVGEGDGLAEVSGSQGGQVAGGEDVGPGGGPRLERHVAGVAVARQGLLLRRLARRCRGRGLGDGQLNGLGQDGPVGFQSAVLQVAPRAGVHLPPQQRRLQETRRRG